MQFSDNSNLTKMRKECFAYCTSLINITLPESLIQIGGTILESDLKLQNGEYKDKAGSCFEGCTGLESITIPRNVKIIGCRAFAGCTNLISLKFEDSTLPLIISAHAFYNTSISTLVFPEGRSATIQYQAFRNCKRLTSVKILKQGVNYIQDGAFGYCNSLVDFSLSEDCGTKIKNNTFDTSYKEGGECGIFEGCGLLERINLKNVKCEGSSKSLLKRTFYNCISLKVVELSSEMELEILDENTFANCHELKQISLPNTIKTIRNNVFSGNEASIMNINVFYEGTMEEWNKITKLNNWKQYSVIKLDTLFGESFTYNDN